MMAKNDERKAVITLPVSGDAEYMNRIRCLSAEERKIIDEKIPVTLDQADEIIRKVLDYHTVSDAEFMLSIKQLIDENQDTYMLLARL